MARYAYERLSDRSAEALRREGARVFAHAASMQLFELGPLANEFGGVDFEAVRAAIGSRLHLVPRLRQKLRLIPIERYPVWVDDADFNLGYHLRHTSLPRPGRFSQLESMAARIMAQRLDRSRPLWEAWVVEGLEGGRFALLLKTHHCMVEDEAADLLQVLLSPDPEAPNPAAPPFEPRPQPSARELVEEEVLRQARLPRRVVERLRAAQREPERLRHELLQRAREAAEALGYAFRPPVATPLNGRVGPHRRFRGVAFDLAAARAIRQATRTTLHDIILAVVAGAVRRFLEERLVSPAALDFRVSTPVGRARRAEGGRVTEWVVDLPVWEKDPLLRLERIRKLTRKLAGSSRAIRAADLMGEGGWFGTRLLALGARALASHTPVNMTVTNAPGSQVPLYFAGARMLETWGVAPLREDLGLSVAVMSYDGRLFFGLNADFDLLPDVDRFASGLTASFSELERNALPGGHG